MNPPTEEWTVISFPCIAEEDDQLGRKVGEVLWPDFYTEEMVLAEQAEQTERFWSALYQQRPSPPEGTFFKRKYIRYYPALQRPGNLRYYGASDYAVSGEDEDNRSFTVHGVAGIDSFFNLYVVDWWRKRAESDEWVDSMLDLMKLWKTLMWAEEAGQIKKGIGPWIKRQQKEREIWGMREQYVSARDKMVRARSIQAYMEHGRIFFPDSAWGKDLVSRILEFPTGKHDDDADVMSLFGRMLDRMVGGDVPSRRKSKKIDTRMPTLNEWIAMQPDENTEGSRRIT